jgi:hypothetical protein
MFVWENAKPTYQGTGFFVKAPDGKIAAVTSIHFLDVNGPRLLEAHWLPPGGNKPAAVFDRSWGRPGEVRIVRVKVANDPGGKPIILDIPPADRRTDYLIMPAPAGVPAANVLELDAREGIAPGERVYFHDKCAFGEKDYTVLEGTVNQSLPEHYEIMLDRDVKAESQSGSPVFSQETGKVIGILAGVGDPGGDSTRSIFGRGGSPRLLVLTPSSAILKALKEGHDFPLLRDVVGKKAADHAPSVEQKP